ncbi:MAG TPA: flagellar biosynthesis protein FlgA [Rhodospirillaceae bacterium]|nr:flagellar biosynthesis protein FlgA [Alphaproteobacteria bacterium]MAS49087.1 flagellar biosynthesis protein FlgA [Alphaproteobacteria bacterium]MAX97311.1 flagellar biosynthesis protein FlgA [Alphaproteobacteria bacterium]MBN52525.1 flagellar biosynthesis protein FlgA [Alphaproteobacteria bacterium]HCI47489.1 flagellar biosynthesis protein FlgA [Rhodospirillaceae bacterium]|tara:strand:- start:27225 stop:28376 length:1152 start_codon:yes stop_codon:yes gene_type:complete
MKISQLIRSAFVGVSVLAMAVTTISFQPLPAAAQALQSRVKDIVRFEGVRENLLVGYGLVVGLNGTGDSLNNAPFTEESLVSMLERLGVNTRGINLSTDNVAAVMVTATLPPFARQGDEIDVQVSSLADAEDLLGGTLVVTPLLGADGEVYAVAQGPVATAAIVAQGDAASIVRGVPTSGRVPGGAIVEREVEFELNEMTQMTLSLRNPDFTTALRIAQVINARLNSAAAFAKDPSSVVLTVPEQYAGDLVSLMADVENLRVSPDQIARVVVDETSGVIVMGANVRISTVAIAQGNLTIRITETPQVSQPNPFSETGDTVVVPRTELEIDTDADQRLTVLEEGVTLQQLVEGLNALGVGPRDIITILQSIKAAGALQADLEII